MYILLNRQCLYSYIPTLAEGEIGMQFIIEDDKVCLGPREYPLPEGNDLPRLT